MSWVRAPSATPKFPFKINDLGRGAPLQALFRLYLTFKRALQRGFPSFVLQFIGLNLSRTPKILPQDCSHNLRFFFALHPSCLIREFFTSYLKKQRISPGRGGITTASGPERSFRLRHRKSGMPRTRNSSRPRQFDTIPIGSG